jgi:hypothetical protein
MASPALEPGKISTTLSDLVVVSDDQDLVNDRSVQEVSWRGRAVRKVLVGTAIAGGALFIFLFVIGSLVDSEPVKFTGAGFGVLGFMSILARYHCVGDYNNADVTLE